MTCQRVPECGRPAGANNNYRDETHNMSGPSSDSGFFGRIGRFFDSYWGIIANAVGAVILAFSTSLIRSFDQLFDPSRWQTVTEWLGVAFFCNGTYLLAKGNLRASQLEAENQQLRALIKNLGDDIQEKWRQVLIPVFEQLNLDNTCRISVYRYEASNFIMLGRFSPDPEKQRTGRGYYPSDQGCIGAAYRNKESLALDLPDPSTSEYYEIMRGKWGIDGAIASKFKMKARAIAAFALVERGTYSRPLVIVFESTEPKAFVVRKLRSICESYNDTLCGLVKELEPLLPSLHYAKQQGF
jgi:hypothetical protein